MRGKECGAYLKHAHVASYMERVAPEAEDGTNYDLFFSALKACGYNGGVSIEGRIDDFEKGLASSISI